MQETPLFECYQFLSKTIPRGIRIKLKNDLFPHCKQQKPIFSKGFFRKNVSKCRKSKFKDTIQKTSNKITVPKFPKGYP